MHGHQGGMGESESESHPFVSDTLRPPGLFPQELIPHGLEFSRQEYWSRQPFPPLGNLPNPGFELRLPALQADSLPSEI